MNKGIIIGIVVAVVVVGAAAFLALPQAPQAPQARTIQLEAREFGFEGLGYKLADKQYKGGPAIQVRAGETIQIILKNSGGTDHEFMVISDVKAASEEAKKMHPEPLFKGAMVEEVKAGQSATITFVAGKAGKYFYACLLDIATKPDTHADRGMFGEFVVQG